METDLRAIKAAAKEEFRDVDGVEGFGIGDQALRIYVRNTEVAKSLPKTFRGVDLELVVTGDITASRV